MHDNPQGQPHPFFALPDHHLIALTGRDAAGFAQAQFMSDVKALTPGHWHWSGWLTPKGRVIALFALLKFSEETLWLLVPDADPVSLAASLRRFVFRSKVTVTVREDLHVKGAFAAPSHANTNTFQGDEQSGVELDLGGAGGPRTLRVRPSTVPAHDPDGHDPDGHDPDGHDPGRHDPDRHAPDGMARWASFDLEHGLPRLPASQSDRWTPQQLSLERLNAFSVRKGCYPGQEIVARTHFLGKVKRGLALIEGTTALHAGDELQAAGESLGHLVASAKAAGRHLALAVVPLERPPSPLTVTNVAVQELPLREGLAR